MDRLVEAVVETAGEAERPQHDSGRAVTIDYGPEIEGELARISAALAPGTRDVNGHDPRWLAVKLLEGDKELRAAVSSPELDKQVAQSGERIAKALGDGPETAIAGRRYEFIQAACTGSTLSGPVGHRTRSDRVDAVLTHRALGIPILLALMYLVFQLTFTLGGPPMEWIEAGFGWLGEVIASWWPEGSESPLRSLLVDGVIGGVGGVVIFLPNILLLFMAIAILEDSGYMARAAFIMDRAMHRMGLEGKSFIPMLIGFGCSVPAIMATRTIENSRARLTTMLITPLMSCGARLPIYALIIPAFFPTAWQAPLLWIIYVTGLLLAVLSAKLLRSTVLKGETAPFVMELPPYRVPTIRGVLVHMWERGWLYLKKAGTVILGISILLWALTTYPALPEDQAAHFETQRETIGAAGVAEEEREESLAAVDNEEAEAGLRYSIAVRMGAAIEPIISPMGFDWRIGTALIGAFAAKEVFVAQMGIVHAVGAADEEFDALRDRLRADYNPLIALCIMLFALVSAPCMATIAVTKRESNSWGWALFQLSGLTVLAYVLTLLVYQVGTALGLGTG